jgi:hypothetical protein
MNKEWGSWRYDSTDGVESIDFSGEAGYTRSNPYQIVRSEIDAPDKLVFWCWYVGIKTWGTPETVGNLTKAVIALGWVRPPHSA